MSVLKATFLTFSTLSVFIIMAVGISSASVDKQENTTKDGYGVIEKK